MEILYTKYSANRVPQFATVTKIIKDEDKKYAVKEPQTKVALPHVTALQKNRELLTRIYEGVAEVCPVVLKDDSAYFEYINGKSLSEAFETAVNDMDAARVNEILDTLVILIKGVNNDAVPFECTPEFREVFGDIEIPDGVLALPVSNMDVTPSNIIVADERLTFIDYEWVLNFPVPLDFVIYRTMMVLYNAYNMGLAKLFTIEQLFEKAGINLDTDILRAMERRYTNYLFNEATVKASATALINSYKKPVLQAGNPVINGYLKLSFDTGDGFSVKDERIIPFRDGFFFVESKVPEGCSRVRANINTGGSDAALTHLGITFDEYKPAENVYGGIYSDGIHIFDGAVTLEFSPSEGARTMILQARITTEGNADPHRLFGKAGRLFNEKNALLIQKDAAIAEKDAAIAEKDAAIAEKDAAIAEKDAAIAEKDAAIAEKDAAIAEKDAAITEKNAVIAEKDIFMAQTQLDLLNESRIRKLKETHLNTILNSRSWKAVNKAKHIYRIIRNPLKKPGIVDNVRSVIEANCHLVYDGWYAPMSSHDISDGKVRAANGEYDIVWENWVTGESTFDHIHFSFDEISLWDGKLRMRGWIFADKMDIKSIGAETTEDGAEPICAQISYPVVRNDVAAVFNLPNTNKCGFEDIILVTSKQPSKLNFILKNGNANAKLYIGTIDPL